MKVTRSTLGASFCSMSDSLKVSVYLRYFFTCLFGDESNYLFSNISVLK
jgi:hypothetical protein